MSSRRILVIKLGAAGDVIRTSTILHLFDKDSVVWITAGKNLRLLPVQLPNLDVLSVDEIKDPALLGHFDLVVSLDEELKCAEIATNASSDKIIGIYLEGDSLKYTDDSSPWFDMGLVSKFGKEKADQIKKANRLSYQDILFEMLGEKFKGEEYLINDIVKGLPEEGLVGIEVRAGKRWPTKAWHKYDELAEKLHDLGYKTFFFSNRDDILDYVRDISKCSLVTTGDSLAMHISLALKRETVALFTCTSPTEIYHYNRMTKIISPLLDDAFYTNDYRLDVLEAIKVEEVLEAIKERIGRN